VPLCIFIPYINPTRAENVLIKNLVVSEKIDVFVYFCAFLNLPNLCKRFLGAFLLLVIQSKGGNTLFPRELGIFIKKNIFVVSEDDVFVYN